MKLTIKLALGNDAFQENTGYEIKRILSKAMQDIESMCAPMKYGQILRDINGNTCGSIEIE